MNTKKFIITSAAVALMMAGAVLHAQTKTINFSGYTWDVKSGVKEGPGPNNWDTDNVWVDANGWLHLTLTPQSDGTTTTCSSSEISTQDRLGFGRYQFWVIGQVDKLDPNVVLGLFLYPTADVGPDGTNEMDIEFSKWGKSANPMGNYSVYPAIPPSTNYYVTETFPVTLNDGSYTTQRFTWTPTSVFFQSLYGHYDNDTNQFASGLYLPQNPATYISQEPMPVHINLWCFQGKPPSSSQQVEVIISAFKFTPM